MNFATALLDHTRSSGELEILLNHDPAGPAYQHGERMTLQRLKLAIKYRQKKVRRGGLSKYSNFPQLSLKLPNVFLLSVRCSPKRPAAAGQYVVRGAARLPSDEHDPPGHGDRQDRAHLSDLLHLLHRLSLGELLTNHAKTLHQVYLQLCLILLLSL